jgi:RNA polymerase sigma-70 factor (ECF subfamily)
LSDELDLEAVRRKGDERAFGRLYDRHTPHLYRFALRLAAGDDGQAQELVHDAWIVAVEKLHRFEGRSSLRTWLGGILANQARDLWHRSDREHVSVHDVDIGEADAVLDFALHRIDLDRAIAKLPAGSRHVFVLHDIEGYTHEAIAELMGIEPGTSKSQLSRARSLLRASLADGKGAVT